MEASNGRGKEESRNVIGSNAVQHIFVISVYPVEDDLITKAILVHWENAVAKSICMTQPFCNIPKWATTRVHHMYRDLVSLRHKKKTWVRPEDFCNVCNYSQYSATLEGYPDTNIAFRFPHVHIIQLPKYTMTTSKSFWTNCRKKF